MTHNEWCPRNIHRQGTPELEHHAHTYGPQAQFGYKGFIPQFRADRYEPGGRAKLCELEDRGNTLRVVRARDDLHGEAAR